MSVLINPNNVQGQTQWIKSLAFSMYSLALGGGGAGATAWGSIAGTLSNQTDLANALTARNPGGSNGQLQFNNAGAFGGVSGWTSNGSTIITGGAGSILSLDTGAASAPSLNFGSAGTGLFTGLAANHVGIAVSGVHYFDYAADALTLKSTSQIGWSSGVIGSTPDLILLRDAANTLAQRNGTNAQTFNLYGTYIDASNYQRLRTGLEADFGGDRYGIFAEKLGSPIAPNLDIGTIGNGNLTLVTNNNLRWIVNGSGHLLAALDATYDVGASGASRPRDIFVGRNLQLGNAATTGLVAGALSALTTASIVIFDSTGTAYRVPCVTP